MNSKSFLFATIFIVLSFFAICFVWEMRSALPEGGGKEIAVGACATGFKSATLKDACPFRASTVCGHKIEYNVPVTLDGCNCEVVVPSLLTGCTCTQGNTACEADDGDHLSPDTEGEAVSTVIEGGCGSYFKFYFEIEDLPSLPFSHTCPKTGKSRTCYIKRSGCKPKNENPTIKSCGDRPSTSGC